MTLVDYSRLFGHKPHLRLVYNPAEPRRWRILDALSDDQLYAHASTLAQAVQFMRSAARKGDATLDEVSVESYSRLADPDTWDRFSVRTGATILPFRRPLEPLDEEVRA